MRPAPWLSDRHPPEPSLRIFPAMPTFFYKQASAPKPPRPLPRLKKQIFSFFFSSFFSITILSFYTFFFLKISFPFFSHKPFVTVGAFNQKKRGLKRKKNFMFGRRYRWR